MHKWNVIPQTKLENNVSNSKKKKPRKMPCYWYHVNVCRIAYGHQDIKVPARNKREAQRAAEDEAGNLSFTEHTSEYQAQTCQRFEQVEPFMGG